MDKKGEEAARAGLSGFCQKPWKILAIREIFKIHKCSELKNHNSSTDNSSIVGVNTQGLVSVSKLVFLQWHNAQTTGEAENKLGRFQENEPKEDTTC